ncbi:MAG: hypothetical protein O3C07_02015, partial [Bacteroidetes bacterium]|nr:hypothetical protein [Bacteroidota bacterium]
TVEHSEQPFTPTRKMPRKYRNCDEYHIFQQKRSTVERAQQRTTFGFSSSNTMNKNTRAAVTVNYSNYNTDRQALLG